MQKNLLTEDNADNERQRPIQRSISESISDFASFPTGRLTILRGYGIQGEQEEASSWVPERLYTEPLGPLSLARKRRKGGSHFWIGPESHVDHGSWAKGAWVVGRQGSARRVGSGSGSTRSPLGFAVPRSTPWYSLQSMSDVCLQKEKMGRRIGRLDGECGVGW